MAQSTQTGASGVEKEIIEKCCFESIDLFLDIDDNEKQNNKITLYKKEESVNKIPQLYFLSNPKGKNIRIEAIRLNKDKCKKPEEHSKIVLEDNAENTCQKIENTDSNEISVKYYDINLNPFLDAAVAATPAVATGIVVPSRTLVNTAIAAKKVVSVFSERNLFNYILLPDLKGGNFLYKKEEFKFKSCVDKKDVQLIVYPDIKYSLTIEETHDKTIKKAKAPKIGKLNKGPENNLGNDKDEDNALEVALSIEYGENEQSFSFTDDNFNASSLIIAIKKLVRFLNGFYFLDKFIKKALRLPVLQKEYVEITVNTPSIQLLWDWQYCINETHTEIGRHHEINFALYPLFGTTITFHLLQIALVAATGGTLAPIIKLATWAQSIADRLGLEADLYINLILSGNVIANAVGEFSTLEADENSIALQGGLEVSAELIAGVTIKAEFLLVKAEASASASGKITVTIEGEFKFTKDKVTVAMPISLLPFQVTLLARGKVQMWILNFGKEKKLTYGFKDPIKWEPELGEFNFGGNEGGGGR